MLTAAKLNRLELSEFSTNEFARRMISDEAQEAFPEKRNPGWTKLNEIY